MKNAISNELTNSLKSGEKDRIHTLRLILAAIKEIGKVIKYLKENSPSSIDMSLASKILREKLQK